MKCLYYLENVKKKLLFLDISLKFLFNLLCSQCNVIQRRKDADLPSLL